MKILYAGQITENDSALYRLMALRRMGYETQQLNSAEYVAKQPLVRKLEFRAAAGPNVARLNRDLLRLADEFKPDVLWTDKLVSLQPKTLDAMRKRGIFTLSYMIDNYFGPRRDPGWRLYAQNIPKFDLHVTQRDVNMRQYLEAGARHVMKVQTAFEPTLHYAPQDEGRMEWSDAQRDRDVSFIGTPYDERPSFLTRLAKEDHIPVVVNGGLVWKPVLKKAGGLDLYAGQGELFRHEYREAIWRSKINLSFLTHSNSDEFVHKSFEITGCGGFLLAERSEGHLARFVEDEEAVFFSSYEECVEKIRRYLPDEAARNRIAKAGHARALASGYDNDTQVRRILEQVRVIGGM